MRRVDSVSKEKNKSREVQKIEQIQESNKDNLFFDLLPCLNFSIE